MSATVSPLSYVSSRWVRNRFAAYGNSTCAASYLMWGIMQVPMRVGRHETLRTMLGCHATGKCITYQHRSKSGARVAHQMFQRHAQTVCMRHLIAAYGATRH